MYYTHLSSLTSAFVRCLLCTAISNTMHSVIIAHTAMLILITLRIDCVSRVSCFGRIKLSKIVFNSIRILFNIIRFLLSYRAARHSLVTTLRSYLLALNVRLYLEIQYPPHCICYVLIAFEHY